MKKHNMIALILAFAVFITWAFSNPITVYAADYRPRIRDEYDRLSDSDEQKINNVIKKAEESVDAVFLVEIYDMSAVFIPKVGDRIVESFGFSTKDDVIVLEIYYIYDSFSEIFTGEGYTYYYKMYTYGSPNVYISDSEVDAILDNENVYNNIKSGNYTDGIIAFVEESAKAMPPKKTPEDQARYDAMSKAYTYLIIVGGIIFYLSIFIYAKIKRDRLEMIKCLGQYLILTEQFLIQ